MATDEFSDDPPGDEAECAYHCHHGWVEVYQDADGEYLGYDRWDPKYAAVEVKQADGSTVTIDLVHSEATYPCPGHQPDLFLRWQTGKLGSKGSE